jgi:hypothetical protein
MVKYCDNFVLNYCDNDIANSIPSPRHYNIIIIALHFRLWIEILILLLQIINIKQRTIENIYCTINSML